MKHVVRLLFISLIGSWLSVACSEDPATKSVTENEPTFEELKAEAMADMESAFAELSTKNIENPEEISQVDFTSRAQKIKALLNQRISDPDLNVAFAMTEMMALYKDPVFRRLILEMTGDESINVPGSSLNLGFIPFNMMALLSQDVLVNNLYTMFRVGINDPDTIAVWQQHFRNSLIPRLKQAIRSLELVELLGDTYEFRITGRMMGLSGASPVYMDQTEFYMMDAYLEYLVMNLNLYLIIDFHQSDFSDVNPDSLSADLISSRIVLLESAQSAGLNALSSGEAIFDNLSASISFLISETDSQNDDVIKKNPNLTESDLVSYLQLIEEYRDMALVYLELIRSFIDGFEFPGGRVSSANSSILGLNIFKILRWALLAFAVHIVRNGFGQDVLPLQTESSFYNIFTERRSNQSSDWSGWNFNTTANYINGADSLRLKYAVSSFFLRHEEFKNNTGVRFYSEQKRFSGAFTTPVFFLRLHLEGALLEYKTETYLDWQGSLSISGPANGNYSFGWMDLKNGYSTRYLIADTRTELSRVSKVRGWMFQGNQPLPGNFKLSGLYSSTVDQPFLSNKEINDFATYDLSDGKLTFEYISGESTIGLSFSSFVIKGKPEYYLAGRAVDESRFTFVNRGAFHTDKRELFYTFSDSESGKTTFSLVSSTRNLDLSGYLESFPFTNGAIVLIGDYLFFDINGVLEELALTGSTEFFIEKDSFLTLSTGWWRLSPELKIQTWEPVFFLIGRRNEKNTGTNIRHLHIVPLAAGWTVLGKKMQFSLNFMQWIPVFVEKKSGAKSGSSSGNGGRISGNGQTVKRETTGGTFVSISAGFLL